MNKIDKLGLNYYNDRTEINFNKLYKQLYSYYLTYGQYRYNNISLANLEILIDKSIETIFRKIHTFKPEYSFKTWATTILINYSNAYTRTKKRNVYIDELENIDYYYDLSNDIEVADEIDYQAILDSFINKLSEKEQILIKKRLFERIKIKDLAVEYNIPLSRMKNKIYAIQHKLINKYKNIEY